jgi:hypothetical protein
MKDYSAIYMWLYTDKDEMIDKKDESLKMG